MMTWACSNDLGTTKTFLQRSRAQAPPRTCECTSGTFDDDLGQNRNTVIIPMMTLAVWILLRVVDGHGIPKVPAPPERTLSLLPRLREGCGLRLMLNVLQSQPVSQAYKAELDGWQLGGRADLRSKCNSTVCHARHRVLRQSIVVSSPRCNLSPSSMGMRACQESVSQ